MKTVLITLESPLRSLDLELAAELPIHQLLPLLLEACGIASSPQLGSATVWSLMTGNGTALLPDDTLTHCAVFDGARLLLRDASGWRQPPAVNVEPAVATSEPSLHTSHGVEVRWRHDDL